MIHLPLAFRIAKTHLLTRKKQSVIAMMGVMFGIAMFIVMISFMQGVNGFLRESALDSSPHIRIYNDVHKPRAQVLDMATGDTAFNVVHHQRPKVELARLQNGQAIAADIEKQPGVWGVSPQLTTQVYFNNGPIQIAGTLAGVDIERENKLYKLSAKMKSGKFESLLTSNNGIIMGKGLAAKMNLSTGDKVIIVTPFGNQMTLRVLGIYATGIGMIDNVRSYTNISTVQTVLMKGPDYITDIHVRLNDPWQSEALMQTFKNKYGYDAEDWKQANSTILTGEKIRHIMLVVVCTTLLVVAGFGIYNIMNMNIYNKLKDIAILKAMGFEQRDIVAIFLIQAILIGLVGALVGISLGGFLSYLLSITPFDGGEFLDIKTFPVLFEWRHYLLGVWFGFVTVVFAGIFPSRKAASVDPVVILRG